MKNNLKVIFTLLLAVLLVTGCGCSKKTSQKNEEKPSQEENTSVVKDQVFEGLEFVNVGAEKGEITTVVINNTGVAYEGSKFSMDVKDQDGNSLVKLTDEVKEPMENGTTTTVVTKTNVDLTKAYSIEYSITE